jgi:hypothetical protein
MDNVLVCIDCVIAFYGHPNRGRGNSAARDQPAQAEATVAVPTVCGGGGSLATILRRLATILRRLATILRRLATLLRPLQAQWQRSDEGGGDSRNIAAAVCRPEACQPLLRPLGRQQFR